MSCRHRAPSCRGWLGSSLLGGAALLLAFGCISGGVMRAEVETAEEHTLPTVGTRRVAITTNDGFVRVRPAAEGSDEIHLRAIVRGFGYDTADAEECLQAIEVSLPVSGPDDSTQEIGWAWRLPKKDHWRASVSFEVTMPPGLALEVKNNNGPLDVVGVAGDCTLKTDNGAIRVVAAKNNLTAMTTNGALTIETPANHVDLTTVNGSVRATLTNPQDVGGSIKSVNGEVRVALVQSASAVLRCRTATGRVKNALPLLEVEKKGRSRLSGRLAAGGESLEVITTNGNISLEPYRASSKPQAD